jgi:hypothetical protein
MKTEGCERYLADPEANASHLDECVECAAIFGSSAVPLQSSVELDALPLAPWEGAAHKSWPLVIGGALTVFCIAAALFTIAGVPLAALTGSLPSFSTLQLLLRDVGDGLQHAPAPWQIAIAISFLVVNTLLIVLLRRAPKGIDV